MSKRYPPEVRDKAVRLALERLDEYGSAYAAARAIGLLVDVHHETLRLWIKKALDEAPSSSAPASSGLSPAEREELARLRKEVRDLKQTNAILKLASLDSNCQRNTLGRCPIVETLAWPIVEAVSDRVEVGLAVGAEVGSLR
jgi:transposase